MKKILLLFLIGFIFGQTDNIGSETFNLTADHLFHSGRDKAFSDGTYLFKSNTDRTTVDTSGMFITDTTVGAALGSRLLQGGEIINSSAADLDILKDFASDGYTVVIDSSGYLLDVPRTVYGWGHDLTFSATDYNTIAWTSGDLYFANLDTFEIVSGSTGNISDPTWIYFDEDVSSTVLQTTPEAGNSVGLGRIIVCVGEDVVSGKDAIFQVFGGVGSGVFIVADNIAANTITTNLLATNSVTTNEILFGSLNSDSLIASINADENTLYINAENIQIGGATTFTTGYNPVDGSVVLYQISAPATRPSGDPLQNGDSWVDTTSAEGNVPRVWTGSEWRVAFTYIHGGYIKTGQVDADYIEVDGIFAKDMTISGSGELHSDGKDSYADNTAGFWLGYDSGATDWLFNIGDATNSLKWNSNSLAIKGNVTLGATNYINTTGKTSYADTDAGFFLGYDSGAYKLNIGNATDNLKWDGSDLYLNDVIIDDATQTDGIITGALIRTATSGERVEMSSNGLKVYSESKFGSGAYELYKDTVLEFALGLDVALGATVGINFWSRLTEFIFNQNVQIIKDLQVNQDANIWGNANIGGTINRIALPLATNYTASVDMNNWGINSHIRLSSGAPMNIRRIKKPTDDVSQFYYVEASSSGDTYTIIHNYSNDGDYRGILTMDGNNHIIGGTSGRNCRVLMYSVLRGKWMLLNSD